MSVTAIQVDVQFDYTDVDQPMTVSVVKAFMAPFTCFGKDAARTEIAQTHVQYVYGSMQDRGKRLGRLHDLLMTGKSGGSIPGFVIEQRPNNVHTLSLTTPGRGSNSTKISVTAIAGKFDLAVDFGPRGSRTRAYEIYRESLRSRQPFRFFAGEERLSAREVYDLLAYPTRPQVKV